MVRRGTFSPSVLYDAARALAVASTAAADADLKERCAAGAATLLGKVAAAGYFENPANAAAARKEPDLDALRSRDDFRGVIPDGG